MKDNSELRMMTRSAYDMQQLRISQGNRIVAQFKSMLGQLPSESEDTLDPVSKGLLAKIRANNKLVTSGAINELEKPEGEIGDDEETVENQMGVTESVSEKKQKAEAGLINQLLEINYRTIMANNSGIDARPVPEKEKSISSKHSDLPKKKKFKGNPIISGYAQLCLIQNYKEVKAQEETMFGRLEDILVNFPLYTEFLKGIPGIGPAMGGVILSEFSIDKANYASSFHMYAGLDVGPDGKGRSKRAEHLVVRQYTDKDGKLQERNSITIIRF